MGDFWQSSGKKRRKQNKFLRLPELARYAARTLLYNMALSMSHKATFSILKNIRKKILEKLPKLPLGTVMDMSSGKMKQIIVDQVDGMETTLAHLFPELTANIAGSLFIVVCLFVLDWRMALLSIVTIPVSGGEKQRVSIARAMLKDAPIVILDEATANVDPENEDRLQKAIEELIGQEGIYADFVLGRKETIGWKLNA